MEEKYYEACREAGMAREQVLNFLRVGVVLQPRQCAASAIARGMDLPGGAVEMGYGGARGGGKSFWMLAQMGADDCQRFPGLKCLLLRKSGKSGAESFRDLLPKTLGNPAELGYRFKSSQGVLSFRNGSSIVLGHFQNEGDISKYLGLEYDVIGIEECTTLTKQKVEDIGSCNRSSKGFRPRIYTTANPGGVGHQFYYERFVAPYREGRETFTRFLPATVYDNAFTNGEYRARLERLSGWRRRAWLEGDWDVAAGQYFTSWSREKHVVSVERVRSVLRYPRRVWLALDWGYVHYAVVVLMAQDGDGNVFVCGEVAVRKAMVKAICDEVDGMLARLGVRRSAIETFVAGGDVWQEKGEGLTVAGKFSECGWTLSRANMARVAGWGEIQERLANGRLLVSETCFRVISCLPGLMHDERNPEDVRKVDCDEDGVGGDDAGDAVRYGVMVVAGGSVGGESLEVGG